MAIDVRGDIPARHGGGRKTTTSPALFYRQVVGELGKVTWPRRRDLITYTAIVLTFVLLMVAIVYGLDSALGWAILRVFGGS